MKSIIAANWKMHKTRGEAKAFAVELSHLLRKDDRRSTIVVFAPFTALAATCKGFRKTSVEVGAQNVYPAAEGAFTGEISSEMIKECGASWVLVGHSERRRILGETDHFVAGKTMFALAAGLNVMLCVGETSEERAKGDLRAVLSGQLGALAGMLKREDCARIAIAYEPVWAIGTGTVASDADIVGAHGMLRELLVGFFGDGGREMPILYGGSVNPGNAGAILKLDNVNGVLVGGASLSIDDFKEIIDSNRC